MQLMDEIPNQLSKQIYGRFPEISEEITEFFRISIFITSVVLEGIHSDLP